MANLSSILNPAPTPTAGEESPSNRAPSTKIDIESPAVGATGPTIHNGGYTEQSQQPQTVTSPGLDALAAVASNFAPLVSPGRQNFLADGEFSRAAASGQVSGQRATVGQQYGLDGSNESKIQPNTQQDTDSLQSYKDILNTWDQVRVKSEAAEQSPDREAKTQLSALKTEFSTGGPSTHPQHVSCPRTPLRIVTNTSPEPSTTTSATAPKMPGKPKPAQARKRAAPKKGTAGKPPANKKRKMEGGSVNGSPSGSRIGTPTTHRGSNTPIPKGRKGNSATPTRGSSIMNEDEGEEEEDDEDDDQVYCICRKPDDHSVMIGCDGPCEDWFHTRCVDMNADKVALISKWFCPNCSAQGHETLWKRMCRLLGCNKPARLENKERSRSKYCSEEHGVEFMSRLLGQSTISRNGTTVPGARRKVGKENQTPQNEATANGGHTQDADTEYYDDSKGGVLRPEELKALLASVSTVEEFRALGERPTTLGARSSSNKNQGQGGDTPMTNNIPIPDDVKNISSQLNEVIYTPEETSMLASLAHRRAELETRREMLLDRDKFLNMVGARARTILAELKEKDKSLKDICGYDPRLTWSDWEFNEWRHSEEGREALRTSALPVSVPVPPKEEEGEEKGKDSTGDTMMTAPPPPPPSQQQQQPQEATAEIGPGICKKKRCERHRAWFKTQGQDGAMEKEEVRQGLKKVEAEEQDVKDRAMIRNLEGLEV